MANVSLKKEATGLKCKYWDKYISHMSDLVCGSTAFKKQLKTDSILQSGKQAIVLCG